jgi:filamin
MAIGRLFVRELDIVEDWLNIEDSCRIIVCSTVSIIIVVDCLLCIVCLVPGDYFDPVKYNGKKFEGSPFKVVVAGGAGAGAVGTKHTMQRRQSTTMMMETVEHTMIRQESSMFNQSSTMSSSRTNSRPIAIQPHFISDATAVTCAGSGLSRPLVGKQNSFTVDTNGAGNNVLFVGVYGPETPCDEVHVKHQGEGQYGVSYKLTDKGQYILYVKWGEDHIPGSPFHIEV